MVTPAGALSKRSPLALLAAVLLCGGLLSSGCVTWNKGLKPVQPSYWPLRSGTSVDSLSPVFEWKAYSENIAGMQNLRYELQIVWKTSVVYRVVTPDTSHVVGKTLLPGQTYTWYVRPVFTVNRQVLTGEWNRQGYFYITPLIVIFGWGERYYQFSTPD